jgi:hypothetical protein
MQRRLELAPVCCTPARPELGEGNRPATLIGADRRDWKVADAIAAREAVSMQKAIVCCHVLRRPAAQSLRLPDFTTASGAPLAPPPLRDENPFRRRADAGEAWCGS